MSDDAFRQRLHDGVKQFSRRGKPDGKDRGTVSPALSTYQAADFENAATLRGARRTMLRGLEKEWGARGHPHLLPGHAASMFERHPEQLGEAGLARDRGRSRIVVEKPFGRDLESARELNRILTGRFRRIPDLPHRPLPGQGDGAEHPGLPLRQRALRADLEPPLHRPRADHRGRSSRASSIAAATTTTPAPCATWCRITCCRSSA